MIIGKISKISLIAVLILFFLGGNSAEAVSAPASPSYVIVETTYDYIAINFGWNRSNESGVGWYHLIYRCKENCSGGNATWVIQPTNGARVEKLVVGGFEFSLPSAAKKYEWQVGACSAQTQGACVYTVPQEFTTPLQPPPPSPTGGQGGPTASQSLRPPIAAGSIQELLNTIINFLFYLSMGIAPVMVIYAAFLILTSGGKVEQVSRAKTIILWTLIAVAIILFAKGLPAVIKGALGG